MIQKRIVSDVSKTHSAPNSSQVHLTMLLPLPLLRQSRDVPRHFLRRCVLYAINALLIGHRFDGDIVACLVFGICFAFEIRSTS